MSTAILWFRQDLRLLDNPALLAACAEQESLLPLYIYDDKHSLLGEAQAWWLHHSLLALQQSLAERGLPLILRRGEPLAILSELCASAEIDAVYWNRCYEPALIARDTQIKSELSARGVLVQSFNGSLLHEPWTIRNKSGEFFKVFTPYWKTCRQALNAMPAEEPGLMPGGISAPSDCLLDWNLLPALDWASRFPEFWTPGEAAAQNRLEDFIEQRLYGYKVNRDFPMQNATSGLSPHLHFGEISPWAVVRAVELAKLDAGCDLASAEHFLSELGWREFSNYLLYYFPQLPKENFKATFDAFSWDNDPTLLKAWQRGRTGYPIVDAGMRELWLTGYMHNRLRMIVASFLTKGLFIDWRLGADWFLDTLLDADLANNSASWQWVAGSGADAAPYFRIFNPIVQSQKFDPNGSYIRRWLPELAGLDDQSIHAPWTAVNSEAFYAETHYPRPIIDHAEARAEALRRYQALKP